MLGLYTVSKGIFLTRDIHETNINLNDSISNYIHIYIMGCYMLYQTNLNVSLGKPMLR